MDPILRYDFYQFAQNVSYCPNISAEYISHMWISVYQSDWQNRFSEPMAWIGMYISLASLLCILAMAADLLHGLSNRKFWFPCKYFTLNAASLTVIAVAIKLPMDLTSLMPGYVDQAAKLGSLGFMCTMMANLLPSLATMNNKELGTNMIALCILVITLVVNVCIQINTGVLSYHIDQDELLTYFSKPGNLSLLPSRIDQSFIATIYVVFLLMLLIIYACSSLAILKSKQILELKYQAAHQTVLKDQELQQPGGLTVEKLKQHVSNYWIMARTGSPQFMTVCYVTTSASGVICASSAICQIDIVLGNIYLGDYKSDYRWSMLMILIIQFIGVILGTVSPLSRCFAALSFKVSVKRLWDHIKVSKVESYWIEKLSDWKQSSIPFPSSSHKCKIVIEKLKILILNICIELQKSVVVVCKMITKIPIFFVICVLYCFRCWKWLKAKFRAAGVLLVEKPEKQLRNDHKDFSRYVLQLEDDMEFSERTLKEISKCINCLVLKAEKQQPRNLMKLLQESGGFGGVGKFDSYYIPPLLAQEYLNWSLPLITLTTIAMSLPAIQNNIVDCLLSSVNEGLVYVTLVEESLNAIDDQVVVQKAAKTLWREVDVYQKWLGNKLSKPAPQANTSKQILLWFNDAAKNIVMEVEPTYTGVRNDNHQCRSISANSMYRITETILFFYHENIDQVSQEELFVHLSSMTADIMAACLTNLPQVISMKCHTSAIEKREESVHAAAQLLGETTKIINFLQDRELPSLDPNELPFIAKWRGYLKDPFP